MNADKMVSYLWLILFQKLTFRPNWIWRPMAWEAEIFPKFGLPILRAGLLAAGRKNVGVLVRLNASARNCAFIFSRTRKFLNREKSKSVDPGPRPTRRAASPNRVIGTPVTLRTWPGSVKAAGLK